MATKKTKPQTVPAVADATDDDEIQVTDGASGEDVSRGERNLKKAKAALVKREEQITELVEEMSGDGVDRITPSAMPKDATSNPGFTIMDIAGIKDWFREFVQWLRDRNATVNEPMVVAVSVPNTSVAQQERQVSVSGSPQAEQVDELTVWEGTIQWRYEGEGGKKPSGPKDGMNRIEAGRRMEEIAEWQAKQSPPVKIQVVQSTEHDAWRELARLSLARRYEV